MKLKKVQYLILSTLCASFILNCAAKPVDIKKQNPKLYKELIRDYSVVSEERPGKVETLKFIENETQSIVGKVDKFPIESCTWFFDRKVKDKTGADDTFFLTKAINLNCGGQYYIIEFDKKNVQAKKLKYQGIYRNIFNQLYKAVILEASCSAYSGASKEDDDKASAIECYPYPYDLDRYTKTQKREVVAGYFLYAESQEVLDSLMSSLKEEKENNTILQELKKDFVNEEIANNQKMNPSIGKNFTFKNCEYIDFREMPVENIKGKELKAKVDKYVDSDLTDPANKEGLKDAMEEYQNCGSRCVSREKEIQILFEIKNEEAKRKILIIKKLNSKSELSKYKRFKFYSVDGSLRSIDYSVKGEIEKVYLNPSLDMPTTESKREINSNPIKEDKPESETKPIPTDEEKPKTRKGKKAKTTELQPIPEPEQELNIEPAPKQP